MRNNREKINSLYKLNNSRIEKKFLCNNFEYNQIKIIVKKINYGFLNSFPIRKINNIYFDDLDNSHYLKSVEGLSNRYKIRLRWYGNFMGLVKKAKLEIKSKKNFVGYKNSFEIENISISNSIFKNNKLLDFIINIHPNIKTILKGNKISSINSYQRDYFESFDKKFRITIDHNINYYDPIFFNLNSKKNGQNLIEVKTSINNLNILRRITRDIPFRLSRYSKYTEGLEKFLN